MPNDRSHHRPHWYDDAACDGMPAELFYEEDDKAIQREAKEVCYACEVRERCLARAIATREDYGIWGGMTAKERRAYRRRLQRAVAQSSASPSMMTDLSGLSAKPPSTGHADALNVPVPTGTGST